MILRYLFINLLIVIVLHIHAQEYNIAHFGAIGNGTTINTKAIQDAIDACHETGGEVVVPGGVFITGTIHLKSNVNLKLDSDAVLKGSPDLESYPFHPGSHGFEQEDLKMRALILADSAENIGISGSGTIDGNGESPVFEPDKDPGSVRPMVICFMNCSHIIVEDIKLVNSPMWMQQYVACEDLLIRGIVVHNHVNRNNSGLDIVGCRGVIISECNISSDDDGICLKTISGSPNDDILISYCMVRSNCDAIKIGTETRADHRYIVIKDCIVAKTGVFSKIWKRDIGAAGLALETVDGGIVEQVMVSDLVVGGVYTPLFIRLGNRGRKYSENGPDPPVGAMKDITITNFNGQSEGPPECSVTGIPGHLIENLELNNVTIHAPGGGDSSLVDLEVPEKTEACPQVQMFGNNLPAYGIYFRHIKGMKLKGLNIFIEQPDHRPAVYLEDVEGVDFDTFRAKAFPEVHALIKLVNARNITIKGTVVHPDASVFVKVAGKKSANIVLTENIIMEEIKPYELARGLSSRIIQIK
jgi:hypothetical protein